MKILKMFSYLIPPGKHKTEEISLSCTELSLNGKLHEMLSEIFIKSDEECNIPICFMPSADESQKNIFRDNLINLFKRSSKDNAKFILKSQSLNENNNLKYTDPLNQIQDQIGARVVTYYLSDIPEICKIVESYLRHIEKQLFVPDSEKEFGYEGQHYILFIPDDVIPTSIFKQNLPNFFELQIKTLFQHAWSEAEHDLGYKPSYCLSYEEKRKISFTEAQCWGADQIFNDLHIKQKDVIY